MAREERDQHARAYALGREADVVPAAGPTDGAPVSGVTGFADQARRRFSPRQRDALIVLALIVFALSWRWPGAMAETAHLLFFAGFTLTALVKLAAACTPRRLHSIPPLADEDLPAYTVIAPLYGEAAVAAELVANLSRLDYPRDRLEVLIVLEAGDRETQAAFAELDLPAGFQVLIAPPGEPRTKPRACNIALERAHGQFVVIYDAEDAPHPDQLREAAARFAAEGPEMACLQAPLRIEPDPRFLPDQFALEYAVLFEVFLPALARWGLPFPLGGTSNHFRASSLRAAGGWDPFNVTEDADVGFRLAAGGKRLGVISLPTLETAPTEWRVWRPQRARWIKGHIHTLAVHLRGPLTRSPRGAAALVLTLALSVAASHLHGPMFVWLALNVLGAMLDLCPPVELMDQVLMVLGWSCSAIAGAVAQQRAGQPPRMLPLVGAIAYWPLQSLAALRALWQFARAPSHWDKTPHAPRATRPLLVREVARTGRALP
jgi:cellulose synthase/poly-beta-1,6-N-acetylglucosamine synthase-like glycosyltransferase